MGVLESDDYRKTREALKADPIIQAMAAEIQQKFNLNAAMAAFTHGEPNFQPNFNFMSRCLDEYKARGGTIGSHIGGPAQAIVMILRAQR